MTARSVPPGFLPDPAPEPESISWTLVTEMILALEDEPETQWLPALALLMAGELVEVLQREGY